LKGVGDASYGLLFSMDDGSLMIRWGGFGLLLHPSVGGMERGVSNGVSMSGVPCCLKSKSYRAVYHFFRGHAAFQNNGKTFLRHLSLANPISTTLCPHGRR
jgi:hypothetical protein